MFSAVQIILINFLFKWPIEVFLWRFVPIKQNEQSNKHWTSHLNIDVYFVMQILWHDN